ncbi:mechanosensitive ion channel family protein [Opitutaceae bacterium TAV4]|uniref:mechanosensitive ion channel family protein n=1 Tax=Geminisphaera colitermitum TaxID=1148786 RepID=UPI000158D472|nr:mechanosensitive ion channel family protein [Geminisphaera colitermitum]RRJ96639.1 mechanosensitive ion channel family protein [Opitutaceae bacterium TAV4]RRK00689.1 mechanosensitive ion channel family protein [Opitutaceae bacterium TAV3]
MLSEIWSHFREIADRVIDGLPAVSVIVILAMVAHILLRRVIGWVASRTAPTFAHPLRWGAKMLLITVSLVLIVKALGFDIGNIWTALSTVLAMVAIGFVAVWSVLSNVSCTMVIMMSRTFELGDEIEFTDPAGVRGKVVNLNFVYTTLRDEDGRLIQVPNNMFFQKIIKRRRAGDGSVSLSEQLTRQSDATVTKTGG